MVVNKKAEQNEQQDDDFTEIEMMQFTGSDGKELHNSETKTSFAKYVRNDSYGTNTKWSRADE